MAFETPIPARNFRVQVGLESPFAGRAGPTGNQGQQVEVAFSQVLLPPFRVGGGGATSPIRDGVDPRESDATTNLVLRRGHTGATELWDWWKAERDRKGEVVRDVTVMLLDHDHEVVTVWNFIGCHVVSLDYSPLDAIESDVLMESLEVSFKAVRQIAGR